MSNGKVFDEQSPAVQSHVQISQAVIQRMANNCASCKAWCITVVSAILVIVADKGNANFTLIAVIPAVLFMVLDGYYLALERGFVSSYNSFVERVHVGGLKHVDFYAVQPPRNVTMKMFWAIWSFSIWPFYVTIAAMILMIRSVVLS